MKANSSNISFQVKKQAIIDRKYFIYHDKKYPVDFDLLKKNSLFFYKNQHQFQNVENIELINEKEECIKLSDESINAFISSCQNEQCSIDKSSILSLQYLAYKFEFNELVHVIDNIFEDHSRELIFATLFFKIYKQKKKYDKNSFFDTSKEEKFIADHLQELIQREEMLSLPIECLYRILTLFYGNHKNQDKIKSDVTIFLFNCLDKYGKSASVLFNIIDFGEQRIDVVNRLLENYSKQFDFNLINQTLTKTVKDLTSEMSKQKEEYSKLFNKMQETFSEQLTELKEMKKQEEEKQKQNEIDNKKRIEDFSSYVNKIKNEFNEKIKSSHDQFKQICTKQEKFIDNYDVQKYHQMILKTITIGQFRKFDENLKDHFIKELFKNENIQSNPEDLLRAKLILVFNSIPESYDYNQIVLLLKNNNTNDQIKIKLTNDKVEYLFQKGQLYSCLTSCTKLFSELLVEIEYPCSNFEQIMKIISDIKALKDKKMKISITINDKSYFELKEKWNKIINTCKFGKSIDVIPEKSFYEFSNLSVLEFSPDIVSIESSSFQNCSSLTEITIPASIKSIGDHCFEGCSKLDRLSINPFYTQIHFNKFDKCPSLKHFIISTARDNKLKTNEHILIWHNMTSILHQTSFLDSSELTSYINECSEIIFEIQYPSSDFLNIYQKVINLKQNNSSKIKIGIFYTQMDITDKYFNENNELNYVRLDSNIKETPNDGDDSSNGSFYGCSSLIEVFVPSSFIKFGNYTFCKCTSLKKINFELPSSLISIGNWAFNGCSSLTQITIPSYVTSIGNCAFYKCSSLTQVSFSTPSSLTFIGNSAFNECSSLTQITIPSFVTSIGNSAFSGCSSLTQVLFSIPSSLTFIGNYAFSGCSKLIQVLIPSSATSIGKYAFSGCSSLTQISIPSLVTSIGENAFYECTSLTQVSFSIPSSVTTIEDYAFYKCSSLKQISIPSSVTSIGENAFDSCSSLTKLSFSSPSSISSIKGWTFQSCSSLTQITIPSTVTSIGRSTFGGCKSLTQVSFASPASVTSIDYGVFELCTSLTQISIPSSVNSIGDSAFESCSSLTQISFSNPSFLNSIGNTAFCRCSSLKQISIPSSVTSIGNSAFYSCSSLTHISFSNPSFLNSIGINAFTSCSSLTQISIPSSVTSIGDYVFESCSSLTQITIPSRINTEYLRINSNATINRI